MLSYFRSVYWQKQQTFWSPKVQVIKIYLRVSSPLKFVLLPPHKTETDYRYCGTFNFFKDKFISKADTFNFLLISSLPINCQEDARWIFIAAHPFSPMKNKTMSYCFLKVNSLTFVLLGFVQSSFYLYPIINASSPLPILKALEQLNWNIAFRFPSCFRKMPRTKKLGYN